MLAEAYYDNGKIEFTRNYRFKHSRFKLSVQVPDEEVMNENPYNLPQEVLIKSQAMLAKLDAIRNSPLPTGNDEEPTEKQLQRMEAFELRAQMRIEQGRPV
ncbi:MAG: hypothetical protein J0665_17220 [Deltaproteobacteria bacterium]|jgi:hypothetical protein|nr:hypothetical protein [Deltaproteobacteria bacterium]